MNTRREAITTRINNPCATLQQIGDKLNLSRERIRQILKSEGLPTKRLRQEYICLQCGAILPRSKSWVGSKRLFCNKKCYHEYTYIQVACDECGKLKERHAKSWLWRLEHNPLITGEHVFCSKRCQGKWLGKEYGFGTRPQHPCKDKKWDYELVWQKHLETGFGCLRLARLLNIPTASISLILAKKRRSKMCIKEYPLIDPDDLTRNRMVTVEGNNLIKITECCPKCGACFDELVEMINQRVDSDSFLKAAKRAEACPTCQEFIRKVKE